MTVVSSRLRRTPSVAWRRLPVALALGAVVLQLVYPRFQAEGRDLVTVVSVVVFAGASLSHAWLVRGWRTAVIIAGVFGGGGLLVEVVGVATGFPFGSYAYSGRLGPVVGGVPLVIPLAWTMMGYPALVLARTVTRRRWPGTVVGAGALAAWDLYLDPQMVDEGYWTWSADGPYLIGTIPVTNYLAWLGIAWLMMMAAWFVTEAWSLDRTQIGVPSALYLWTWSGSFVAHLFYFDLPQSALYGGVGMGLFVALLVVRLTSGGSRSACTATGRDAETCGREAPDPR